PFRKHLLLTLDGFNTLYTPRAPIASIYATAAYNHGIPIDSPTSPATLNTITKDFNTALRRTTTRYPNYGKTKGLTCSQWWEHVMTDTFRRYIPRNKKLPLALVQELLSTFASKRGYMLYDDVLPLIFKLRARKDATLRGEPHSFLPQFDTVTVGVLSNSDSNVPAILTSLGLRVGPYRPLHKLKTGAAKAKKPPYDVDFVSTSFHSDFEKPDRRAFGLSVRIGRGILDEMGIKGGVGMWECVHVGDDLEKDVNGAKMAGWRGVYMCRDGGE
ncbi:hypothetical protein T440DRAFT_377877, partial [Plenodomus tracheiphilus IPT5]